MRKSKYNIDQTSKGKEKRTYNNILFDSELECNYYINLLGQMAEGKIVKIERQPKYLLQPKFEKNGKKYQAIYYVADFLLTYSDNSVLVVDTKGVPTADAKLKSKIFNYIYPDLKLVWIGYSKVDGGFVPLEVIERGRKERKQAKLAIKKGI